MLWRTTILRQAQYKSGVGQNPGLLRQAQDKFDAQADTFHEAQATAVEQFGRELMIAGHLAKNGLNFIFGENDRQMLGLFSPDNVGQGVEFLL